MSQGSYFVNYLHPDPISHEHDSNGSLLAVRNGGAVVRGYDWDAANRLAKVTYTDGGSTTFQYDGMNQRRIITEKDATGTVTGTTRLLWKGGRVWQEQDSSGRVTKRYHFNGVQTLTYTGASTTPDGTTSTLTLADHLGSQREMVTFSGGTTAITGRRDFDPYGKATQEGTAPTNGAYTGHWLHDRSGLELALYRAYVPELGRWLNEDPLEEEGGLNLYEYARNRPIMAIDLMGLDIWVEGSNENEPALHMSIAVGDPRDPDKYRSWSFATDWSPCEGRLGGIVYHDFELGGVIDSSRYLVTDGPTDAEMKRLLDSIINDRHPYNFFNNCNTFSHQIFDKLKSRLGLKAKPGKPPVIEWRKKYMEPSGTPMPINRGLE